MSTALRIETGPLTRALALAGVLAAEALTSGAKERPRLALYRSSAPRTPASWAIGYREHLRLVPVGTEPGSHTPPCAQVDAEVVRLVLCDSAHANETQFEVEDTRVCLHTADASHAVTRLDAPHPGASVHDSEPYEPVFITNATDLARALSTAVKSAARQARDERWPARLHVVPEGALATCTVEAADEVQTCRIRIQDRPGRDQAPPWSRGIDRRALRLLSRFARWTRDQSGPEVSVTLGYRTRTLSASARRVRLEVSTPVAEHRRNPCLPDAKTKARTRVELNARAFARALAVLVTDAVTQVRLQGEGTNLRMVPTGLESAGRTNAAVPIDGVWDDPCEVDAVRLARIAAEHARHGPAVTLARTEPVERLPGLLLVHTAKLEHTLVPLTHRHP